MWNLLMHHKYWPIALDMGTSAIRMLQFQGVGGRLAAAGSACWKYPHEARTTDPARRRELAVGAVRTMLKNGRFRGRRVVTALATSQLCIKNFRMEVPDERKLDQIVLAEARERFNFDVQPDQLNYLNAGQIRQGAEVRNEIIMLAVGPDVIAEHLAMMDDMGLYVEHVDAEPVAMFRGFVRFLRRTDDEQSVSVIVDIGMGGTRVVVARGRQIIFIKSIEIGGQKLTESVARKLSISYEEASDLRLKLSREGAQAAGEAPAQAKPPEGDSMHWTIVDSLRAEVEALAREINLCLRYCSVTFRGFRPETVTVIGGEAYDAGVMQLLAEGLGIPCVVGRPLKGIDTSSVDLGSDRRGMLTEWAICAGLSARGIDVQAMQASAEPDSDRVSA